MDTLPQLFGKILHDVQIVRDSLANEDHNMLHYYAPRLLHHKSLFENLLSADVTNPEILEVTRIISDLSEAANSILNISENSNSRNMRSQNEYTGHPGRPRLIIPVQQPTFLRENGMSWSKIARFFNVSARTLKRWRTNHGIQDDMHPHIPDELLDSQIRCIKTEHPHAGYVYVWASLKAKNLRVTWKRLKERMRIIDPVGIHLRMRRRLKRRRYRVKGANYLWHMDANEKLVAWHFYIHGCVDGHSRKIIYLKLSTHKEALTVFKGFIEGVNTEGLPLRVRGDGGTENNIVKDYMSEVNNEVSNSFIVGRSVHNTRIERLWGEVNRIASFKYKNLFLWLEYHDYLDELSMRDLLCLHYVFFLRIKEALQSFKSLWNHHSLRTETTYTPNQLWSLSILQQLQDKRYVRNLEFAEGHIKATPLLLEGFDEDEEVGNPTAILLEQLRNLSPNNPEMLNRFIEIAQEVVPSPLAHDQADGISLYLDLRAHCAQRM